MADVKDDDIRTIERASGILIGIVGLMGVVMPFTKQPLRESLQLGMASIGISISLLTIISKATEQTNNKFKIKQTNGQEN